MLSLICAECGKAFERQRWRHVNKRAFCSRSCAGKAGRPHGDLVVDLKQWFESNPEEELTMEQICNRWGIDNKKAWKKLRYAKNKGWFNVKHELIVSSGRVVAMTVWSKA